VTTDPLLRKHGALGKLLSRIDGPLKVQGKARFAAEFPYENIYYAALVFSLIARGRITKLDTGGTDSASGVGWQLNVRMQKLFSRLAVKMTLWVENLI
jgi:xanthine dehydrogenase YagR molybdenum-binding subunit